MKKKNKKKSKKQADNINVFRFWIDNTMKDIMKVMAIDFVNISFELAEKDQETRECKTMFSIAHLPEYHEIHIKIYPISREFFKNKRLEELKAGLVHEVCHMHTTNLYSMAVSRFVTRKEIRTEIEHVTETIAFYVKKVLNNNNNNK